MRSFPRDGVDAQTLEDELADYRRRDATFASGRILGSMCTTPHPAALEAYRAFQETNLGDPVLFPGTEALEKEAETMLLDLLHGPPGGRTLFVGGGSEANLTGLRIARETTGRREVVLPRTYHFSFDKACRVLDLVPRVADVGPDMRVDVDHVAELAGPDTAAIVGIAGTTEFGTVDPIPELAQLAMDVGAACHVDAALGGFLLPFLDDPPAFDLAVEGVTTLTVDPHKMGRAPVPCGVLATGDPENVQAISVPSPYVSTTKQSTIAGTRPGAAPAAAYAAMRSLGRAGYRAMVATCLENARFLADAARKLGAAAPVDPPLNVVPLQVPDPRGVQQRLRGAGWYVNLAPLSGGIKVVVMPHVTREALEAFLPALEAALDGDAAPDGASQQG